MSQITILAVETIHYSQTYDLADLEEVAGVTLAECDGDLSLFAETLQEAAGNQPGFCEGLERHGDVQGQVWTLTEGAGA